VHDPRTKGSRPRSLSRIALLTVSVGSMQFVLEHGQREDWFDSRQILSLSVIGVVGWMALMVA